MAQVTERSPNGVMGKTYNTFSGFAPKTPAPVGANKTDYRHVYRVRRNR